MGTFCTNVTLVGADPAAVEARLVAEGRAAFLGTWGAHTVVFDEAGEAQDGSHAALAAELSAVLGCGAIASLDHDDDILYLQVFEAGELRGEFNSAPDYFDDMGGMDEVVEVGAIDGGAGAAGGRWSLGLDPATLVRVAGAGDAARVAAIAARDEVFAGDLHHALVTELGLPTASCSFGFRSLDHGETPDDADAGHLRRVGPTA